MAERAAATRMGDRALGLVALLLFLSGALGLGLLQAGSPGGVITLEGGETIRSLGVATLAMVAAFGIWRRARWGAAALGLWSLLVLSRLFWPPTPVASVSLPVQMGVVAVVGGLLAWLNTFVWRRIEVGRRPG